MVVAYEVLGFSPQAYCKWRANPVFDRDWNDAVLTNAIVDIHADDPEFGYRFSADELEDAGHVVGEGRVHRLCKRHKVWSATTRKGRRAPGSGPGLPRRRSRPAGLHHPNDRPHVAHRHH